MTGGRRADAVDIGVARHRTKPLHAGDRVLDTVEDLTRRAECARAAGDLQASLTMALAAAKLLQLHKLLWPEPGSSGGKDSTLDAG